MDKKLRECDEFLKDKLAKKEWLLVVHGKKSAHTIGGNPKILTWAINELMAVVLQTKKEDFNQLKEISLHNLMQRAAVAELAAKASLI